MIVFDPNFKSLLLNGKSYSYAMYVNKAGFLQQLYYGKKLTEKDVAFLIKSRGDAASPNSDDINSDMATDAMPSETGSFGRGDFRSATVIVRRADGAAMSSFRYVRHVVSDGAPQIKGMPSIRKADKTLTVTLKDDFSQTEIDLNYSVSDDSDVLVRNLIIRNVGKTPSDVAKAFSFCAELPDNGGEYKALRLAGAWASERKPVITPLAEGVLRIESTRGYSSHAMNPFIAVLADGCGENVGECYGFNLLYSGSFAITAEVSSSKSVRVQGGVNDYMFGWRLNGLDSFITPQVALCFSDEGLGGLSRAYHDFYREYVINPKRVYERRPVVVNNWEATYFDFDEKKLFAIIDEAAKLGIDTFVLDDGWFGRGNGGGGSSRKWYRKIPTYTARTPIGLYKSKG